MQLFGYLHAIYVTIINNLNCITMKKESIPFMKVVEELVS